MKTENRKQVVPANQVVLKNLTVSVTDKDFSDTLTVTRTLFNDVVSKTSIVEASLACAASTASIFSCTKIASFIVNTLNVKDCFHKRESNKQNNAMNATVLRVRHHVIDTIKVNHIADKLYSYNKENDCILFTDKYVKICKEDITYRKKVSALIKRAKYQYSPVSDTDKKTENKVNAELAYLLANQAATAVKTVSKKVKLNKNNAEHRCFIKAA